MDGGGGVEDGGGGGGGGGGRTDLAVLCSVRFNQHFGYK